MSIAKPVAQSIAQAVARSVSGAASGGAGYNPANQPGVLQVLNGFSYAATSLDGLPVLQSSVGTLAVPRGQRCYLADGTDDYIAVASLTGSETVVSKEGTSTVSITAGRINLTAGTVWNIVLSNGSTYYCTEESGTTAYDSSGLGLHGTITNATLATFHSTSTSVLRNWVNDRGYSLSGSVVVPRNESGYSTDVAGGSLQYAGPIALPAVMEVPCITGDGTAACVDLGSPLIPASTDFTMSFWYYAVANGGASRGIVCQDDFIAWVNSGLGATYLQVYGNATLNVFEICFKLNAWNFVTITKASGNISFRVINADSDVSSTPTTSGNWGQSANTKLLTTPSNQFGNGRIADFRITAGGVTKYFPLQDGPGSSNTNRDIAWVGSDSTGGVVSSAVVNGTVATIWANRTAYVQDWSIKYGGGIAANGGYIAGRISSANDAAGNAKTLAAGSHGNPYSKAIFNYWSAPSLVNIGSTASDKYAPSDMAGVQAESVADTRFASQKRYAAFRVGQTGSDKTNAESWAAG